MKARRLPLRGRKPTSGKKAPVTPVPFQHVPLHGTFYISPRGGVRLAFIKLTNWGARVEDWGDDCEWPSQSFAPDYLVYTE